MNFLSAMNTICQTAAGIRAQAFTAMCGLPLPMRLISYIMERIFPQKNLEKPGKYLWIPNLSMKQVPQTKVGSVTRFLMSTALLWPLMKARYIFQTPFRLTNRYWLLLNRNYGILKSQICIRSALPYMWAIRLRIPSPRIWDFVTLRLMRIKDFS